MPIAPDDPTPTTLDPTPPVIDPTSLPPAFNSTEVINSITGFIKEYTGPIATALQGDVAFNQANQALKNDLDGAIINDTPVSDQQYNNVNGDIISLFGSEFTVAGGVLTAAGAEVGPGLVGHLP